MSQLKPFEDVVEFSEGGQKHPMIVVAVKADGHIDGVFCKRLFMGDGKTPVNVIGSSRQGELIQFRHDVARSQYEIPGDFFFLLSDEQASALDEERKRRQHEVAQAEQARAAQAEESQLLDGVTIKPSEKVLERAGELWRKEIQLSQGLGEHDDVLLPDYKLFKQKWDPWVEKAKSAIALEKQAAQRQTPPGEANEPGKPSGEGGDGLVN